MEAEQMTEFVLVRNRAVAHFRECGHIRISKHSPQAQFLILPSFTDSIAVDIVRTDDDLAAYVTFWRQTSDIEAFATPVERLKHPTPFIPSYDSSKLDISPDSLDSLMLQLSNTHVSLSDTTNSVSLDGTAYELSIGTGSSGIRLRWQNRLPAEWSPIRPVVEHFQEMARSDVERAT